MPKVSVVMPAYNAEKYIGEAIDSILNQTFEDFEFIIIDDCSSDRTAEIIKSYTDKRIRFYQNEHNLGVAATLNLGLDLATGEYIARMDSDDISLPERFEKQVVILDKHEDIAVCGSNAIVFSETREYRTDLPVTDRKIKYNLFISSPFIHPAVMMRKSIITNNKLRYSLEFEGREDHQLWMQFSLIKCKFFNICEPLLKYRIHDGQVTQKNDTDKLMKHNKMKVWYLDSMGIDYSADEMDALCRVSVGEPLESSEQIDSLKRLITKIYPYFNEKCIPDFFLRILYIQAKSLKCLKQVTHSIYEDQPIKVKLKWRFHIIRGMLWR